MTTPGEPKPADPRSEQEELLFLCLEAREAGGSRAVEEILAAHPEHAAELRGRLEALSRSGLIGGGGEDVPERLGDFLLREKLGEGGMGIVYRAEQVSLGREVALKLVRPERLYFGDTRARFQREVETIASLHHPGIVAVYSVGEESGVPFFAMELVNGLSLDAILEGLRDRSIETLRGADLDPTGEGAGYLFAGSWEDACLRVVRQVCEALQFAHGRDVLHRDIKPSNVMIAGEGTARAQLLDFGLARAADADKLTRTGSLLGSLRYMAPEQIRGEVDELGPTTDLYGLGVTLFEMLTLTPAFEGSQTEVALAVTQRGLPAVRTRNRRASWEVETIVAKATDPEPRRRYASAADMARDLANALERRPIEARRAGAWLRLQRWSQRHPAGATALLLGALVATGAPTAYAWQQRSAARAVAAQRDAALRAFRYAMEAIDRMLTRVGGDELAYLPAMEALREGLLEDAVELLERVVQEGGLYVSREGRYELASARQRLGQLFGLVGDSRRAATEYEEGRRVLRELLAEDPEDVRAGSLYVSATTEEAGMRQEAGDLELGLELHEELGVWLSSRAHVPRFAAAVVRNRAEKANALGLLGRFDEAHAEFAAACPALDEVARGSGVVEDVLAAATAWSHYGDVWLATNLQEIDDEGLRAIERSLELFRRALELDPAPRHASMMCAALNNTAGAYRRAGRAEEADDLLEEAQTLLTRLVDEHPSTLTFELELAAVLNQIALLRTAVSWEEALPWFERGSKHLAHVAAAAPDVAFFQHRYAIAQYNLASALEATGAPPARLVETLTAGVEAGGRALALAPDAPGYATDVLEMSTMAADLHLDEGDPERAVAASEAMLRHLPADAEAARRAAERYARAVGMLRADERRSPEGRDAILATWAARACELIRQAAEGGVDYGDLTEVASLETLHEASEFGVLVDWYEQRNR